MYFIPNYPNNILSPQSTSIETNLKKLKYKWRKYFSLEYNEVKCISQYIGDQRIVEMADDISKSLILHQRRHSRSLFLNFTNCGPVSQNGLKYLFHEIIPLIKDVQDFKLKIPIFEGSQLNCYQVFFQETLRNLKKLESFSLQFHFASTSALDEQALEYFVKELGKNQQKLKHLKLDLSYCRLPSDESLQMIGKEIGRRLHDLQSFTLILGG